MTGTDRRKSDDGLCADIVLAGQRGGFMSTTSQRRAFLIHAILQARYIIKADQDLASHPCLYPVQRDS